MQSGILGFSVFGGSAGTGDGRTTGAAGVTGSSFPHNNMQPYLAVTFCIALQGVFPPRS